MHNFDLSEFFALLHKAGVDAEELSAIQLDQYISAYHNGAREVDSLKSAVDTPKFPIETDIYANIDHDYLCEVGEQLGLGGEPLRNLTNAAGPVMLHCTVEEDGSLIIQRVEQVQLTSGIILN